MTLEDKKQIQAPDSKSTAPDPRRPNESGAIRVEAYFRISDPEDNRTILEGRA